MSHGRVPAPDFDERHYERPNEDWLCGHACEGCPCRIGPSPDGQCRATTECTPKLILEEGETKGMWKCTRPKDWGGACENGPRPDGTCCRQIRKCRPARSLRAKRGLLVRATVLASVGVLLIGGLNGPGFESFINPGALSRHHSSEEFAAGGRGQGCVLCHAEAAKSFPALVAFAAKTAQTSLSFDKFVTLHPKDFSRMDRSCLKCHGTRSYHQASLERTLSCSVCHLEHQGAGSLPPVAESKCTTCHGDASEMLAAAHKARRMPAAQFAKPVPTGLVFAAAERPPEGFTRIITSFAKDHPEFEALREKRADATALKFNHKKHQEGDIPVVNGQPLDCAYCHRPDASGAFMQRVTFEQNCRACHTLNFNDAVAGVALPHGDAALVRGYLRDLPEHFASAATTSDPALKDPKALAAAVDKQMLALGAQNVAELEKSVFLGEPPAGATGAARAKAAGCAFCHEVSARESALPEIRRPQMPDRWLAHAKFNHARHDTMRCTDCHEAEKSEKTSDIILPSQQSCVQCHSAKGGAVHHCSTCHSYHNTPPP